MNQEQQMQVLHSCSHQLLQSDAINDESAADTIKGTLEIIEKGAPAVGAAHLSNEDVGNLIIDMLPQQRDAVLEQAPTAAI